MGEVDTPEPCSRLFSIAAEDEVVSAVVNMECMFVEVRVATCIAEFPQAE